MTKPESVRAGFEAFMLHLEAICKDSLGSPDLPLAECEELNEGRMRLRCVTPGLQRIASKTGNSDEIYQLAWELAAGAFLVGSRGVVSDGARKHTRADNARVASRSKIEQRNKGTGRDAEIDKIISKYMNGPVKTVLPDVNRELAERGLPTIAASTISRRRLKLNL